MESVGADYAWALRSRAGQRTAEEKVGSDVRRSGLERLMLLGAGLVTALYALSVSRL